MKTQICGYLCYFFPVFFSILQWSSIDLDLGSFSFNTNYAYDSSTIGLPITVHADLEHVEDSFSVFLLTFCLELAKARIFKCEPTN